jgi:hypothetical protein
MFGPCTRSDWMGRNDAIQLDLEVAHTKVPSVGADGQGRAESSLDWFVPVSLGTGETVWKRWRLNGIGKICVSGKML